MTEQKGQADAQTGRQQSRSKANICWSAQVPLHAVQVSWSCLAKPRSAVGIDTKVLGGQVQQWFKASPADSSDWSCGGY